MTDRLISHATAIKLGLYPQPQEKPQVTTTLHQNFLTHLLTNVSHDEAQYAYVASINALTSRIVWALSSHFGQEKRITDHIPTLDERNELEESARGERFTKEYVRPAQGHDEPMTQYEIATICDRVRCALYEQLREFYAIEPAAETLYRQTVPAERPPIWMPQSIEGYLLWQLRTKSGLNDNQQRAIHLANATFGEDLARKTEADIKRNNAQRAAEYRDLARAVLTEVLGWENTGEENEDAFTKLPPMVQVEIAEQIQNALFNRSIKVLSQNRKIEELQSECNMIRGLAVLAAQWLNQPTIKNFRGLIAYRAKQAGRERATNPLLEKAEVDDSIESMADDPV